MESKASEAVDEGTVGEQRTWAFLVRFFVMLFLSIWIHFYIAKKLAAELPESWSRVAYALVGAAYFVTWMIGTAKDEPNSRWWSRAASWAGEMWWTAYGLLFSALVLMEGVRFLAAHVEAMRPLPSPGAQVGAVFALVALTLLWGHRTALGKAKVTKVRVPIPKLGKGLEGLRIVQLSDLHLNETLGARWLSRVVAQTNALAPDVVAITGDLVDGPLERLREELRPLAELKAKEGIFYVTGDQEYSWNGLEWEAELRHLGLTVLHNEHRVLSRGNDALVIAGVTDLRGRFIDASHTCRPKAALHGAPEGVPRVLLAHQPRVALLVQGLGVDLQLSGHTHGGQLFPLVFLDVMLGQGVLRGLTQRFGTWVYTSRGLGYVVSPFRIGASPEIAEITLVGA